MSPDIVGPPPPNPTEVLARIVTDGILVGASGWQIAARLINDGYTTEGVGDSTPRHKPPRMEDERGMVDGVFEFYDVDYYAAVPLSNTASMEVVPQTTGNVEITLADSMFTLSHLDRADLIRALLHEFHYSTERGGPNDDH